MKNFIITLAACMFLLCLNAQVVKKTSFGISGQIMTDASYNFNKVNPDYFDVLRPTQLPAYRNQYGTDANVFLAHASHCRGLMVLPRQGIVN